MYLPYFGNGQQLLQFAPWSLSNCNQSRACGHLKFLSFSPCVYTVDVIIKLMRMGTAVCVEDQMV